MSEPVDAPPSDPSPGARVGGPQRQARALATRSAILAAAAEEFAAASYHEASLSRILERSKVTKGALYFHFVSKESIASAVVDEMEVLCRDVVVRARGKGGDPLCTAAQVAREVQDALAGPVLRAGQRLCSEGFAGPERPGWPFTFWEEVFGGLFAEAARAGLLAPGVDHASLARAVVDISAGAFVTSLGVSGLRDLALRVCQNWELLLGAVADPGWLREWRAGGGMGAVLGPHLTGGWVVEA
jgi:AcrR family transcriptional regulator